MKLHSFFSTKVLIGGIGVLLIIGFTPYFHSIAKETLSHADSVAYGITIGDTDISGMSEDELRNLLEYRYQQLLDKGISITFNGSSAVLRDTPSLESDIPAQAHSSLFSFDYEKTIQDALSAGHSGSVMNDAIMQAALFFAKQRIPITTSINEDVFGSLLEQAFPEKQHAALSADLKYDKQSNAFSIVPEQAGTLFDIDNASQQLQNSLRWGAPTTITLNTKEQNPVLRASDIQEILPTAAPLVRKLTLKTDDTHSWNVSKTKVASWITVTPTQDKRASLSIRSEALKSYLKTTIAPALFTESKDPRFEMKDGKIIITVQPQDGQKLALEETMKRIEDTLLSASITNEIILPIEYHPSAILGIPNQDSIKEIVGQAETDFRGSPQNREKNIANGASRINGIFIQPGEEFSLLSYLHPIDETTGFLPELVIKGNVTKPEYGGGLCQVSTTLFRAVSYAGLPITKRRNHSYRVSYYEPPVGFDATIYSPAPDFAFRNDMATPLLVQTNIKGTKISVTLWGAKDGRISEVDKPTVYNIRKPPETKIIETTELEPGKKKCTEKAHAGADAFFERRVRYPSGEVKKETFKSHYVVWPAVCYIGKENESTSEPADPLLPIESQMQSAPQIPKTAP